MLPKKTLIYKYLFLLTITVAIVAPFAFLYAQTAPPPAPAAYVPLAPLPTNVPPGVVTQTGLAGYLQYLFWFSIVAAGVLAVLMITKGGILYMTTEAFNTKGEAKTQITMAIVGFLLAISSVLILTTINPELLNFKLLVRPLTFELPPPGVAGSIPGCTTSVTSPTGACAWYLTGIASCQDVVRISQGGSSANVNDYKDGNENDCSTTKPASGYKCCLWSMPQNGCSGTGRWVGKTRCQWSSAGSIGDSCQGTVELDAGLSQVSDTFCSAPRPNNDNTYDCCAK